MSILEKSDWGSLCSLFLLLAVLAFASCKKNKCPEGFNSVDDQCLCPDGKFVGNGMCRDLKPNEYYASLAHCACPDTIFVEIIERNDINLRVRFDLGWGYEETGCGLIKMADGDSLYTTANSTFTSRLACPINGKLANTQIFGKFIENDTKIRVTLKYMRYPTFEEELGKCEFVLHK
ncbi:MAG: hypothetical protein KIS77_19670 [Saprospiraceae bacterium]|nr:hypothetical protein [Saprospiraceae bacterium]